VAEMRFREIPYNQEDRDLYVKSLIAFCEDDPGCRKHALGVKVLNPMKEHKI